MSRSPEVILIIGEGSSNDSLAYELALDGYHTLRTARPERLGALSEPGGVDLIIMIGASQQASMLHAVRALRTGELGPEINPTARLLWIAATEEVAEVLRAFEAGADDVIRRPFVHAELLARVRALMRRGVCHATGVIQFGPLRIDTNAHTATFASTPLRLRRLEYELLTYLARNPSRVYTKNDLLREVWHFQADVWTRAVDTQACRLRRALTSAGASGWLITVRGVGYRLAPERHGELRLLASGRRSA